jgi:hypothetical protein
MLFAYLDESGIGDISREKHVIIAGVIVRDVQIAELDARIGEVRDKHVPERYRNGFIFHASDLYQSTEKVISRNDWPTANRWDALEELMSLVGEFELPVAQSNVPREQILKDRTELTPDKAVQMAQAIAATTCMLHIERFATLWTPPDTQVTLIYENNDSAREAVKQQQEFMSSDEMQKQISPALRERIGNLLPPRRVLTTPQFAKKEHAPILQLADACAYIVRRVTFGKDCTRFTRHIKDLVITNREGRWTLGKPVRLPTES